MGQDKTFHVCVLVLELGERRGREKRGNGKDNAMSVCLGCWWCQSDRGETVDRIFSLCFGGVGGRGRGLF